MRSLEAVRLIHTACANGVSVERHAASATQERRQVMASLFSRNRRGRFPRFASLRGAARAGSKCSASTISSPARAATSTHLLDHPRFELMRHDMTFPLYVEVDEIYNLACPASPDPLPVRPGADDQDQRAWARSTCSGWPSGCKAPDPPGLDQRGLRRPGVHPQTESYWGNVNPIGPRACYDEGKRCAETLFFDYHRQHNLRHQGRAHLQYLRPAHASE